MSAVSAVLFVVALLAAALCSGLDLASAGANRLKLELERRQSRLFDAVTGLFARHPEQYLATRLLLGIGALVLYAGTFVVLSNGIAEVAESGALGSPGLQLLVAVFLFLLVAVVLPGALVRRDPSSACRAATFAFLPFHVLFAPVAWPLSLLIRAVVRLGGRGRLPLEEERFDREELESLLEANNAERREGGVANTEIKLFRNALDFADLRVRDCMVPRVDIEAVEEHTPIADLAQRFVETMYSRIFVWRGSIDHIIGYVNAKRLFTRPATVADALRPVGFVSETMPLQEALQNFIRRRSNVAVVIDEFGGTAGILSLEDVLEQIFGEIEDEHDQPELTEQRLGENEYLFSCRLEVKQLNERYGLGIEERREYDTLAGFVIYRCGGLPTVGELFVFDGLEVEILRTTRSRIELARVRKL